jgi:hypothetical protein
LLEQGAGRIPQFNGLEQTQGSCLVRGVAEFPERIGSQHRTLPERIVAVAVAREQPGNVLVGLCERSRTLEELVRRGVNRPPVDLFPKQSFAARRLAIEIPAAGLCEYHRGRRHPRED